MRKQLIRILLMFGLIPAISITALLVWLSTLSITHTIQETLLWSSGAFIVVALITTIISIRFAKAFIAPLNYLTGGLTYLAKDIEAGDVDLTRPFAPPGKNLIANSVAKGINTVLGRFVIVLKEFSDSTNSIAISTQQVETLSSESSTAMVSQREETDQVATAITELSSSAEEVARTAKMGADAAKTADLETKEAASTVTQAANTIQDLTNSLNNASTVIHGLESDSDSIGSVLAVIQGIAEQTNLLALNAAIEAARAGEQGRGFAVVADEVRTLAGRTQDATQEIKSIIEQLQNRSKEAVSVMDVGCEMATDGLNKATRAGEALQSIAAKVADIDNMNALISSAAQEQRSVSNEVSKNVVKISQLTEHTTDGATQTSQASAELMKLATHLKELVTQFKL